MNEPVVICTGCGRQVECIRVKEGTLYRPFAWTFADAEWPLLGVCGGCPFVPSTTLVGEEASGNSGPARSPGAQAMNQPRVFGLSDWEAWLDEMARAIFGVSGAEFEASYPRGTFGLAGVAGDLASVLPLIQRLRLAAGTAGRLR